MKKLKVEHIPGAMPYGDTRGCLLRWRVRCLNAHGSTGQVYTRTFVRWEEAVAFADRHLRHYEVTGPLQAAYEEGVRA